MVALLLAVPRHTGHPVAKPRVCIYVGMLIWILSFSLQSHQDSIMELLTNDLTLILITSQRLHIQTLQVDYISMYMKPHSGNIISVMKKWGTH